MVRLTSRRLCRVLLVLLVALGIYLLFLSERTMSKRCSKEGSLAMLQKLCALYAASKVDGNLCPKICSPDLLRFERCFNRLKGKKVLQVQLDGRRAMLKSRYAEISEYRPLIGGLLGPDVDTSKDFPERFMAQETFAVLVRDHVKATFGTALSVSKEEVLHRLMPGPSSEDLTNFQMNSFWALLQQEEYLFFMFYKDISFFPNIYGACGHFYVEEYIPPGAVLEQSVSQGVRERYRSAAWRPRAKAARDLLDIVRATETDFHEILHLCDVKPENFGIADGRVKAIDIDISFFDKTMGGFLQQPNCSRHEDCDFFDCEGVCDFTKRKCTRKRRNNNFQAICRDVFRRKVGNPGLLRHPPPSIEEELSLLLLRCVNPDEAEQVAKGSGTETFRRLHRLLLESIDRGL